MSAATPDMIQAAWRAFRQGRPGQLIGPGPAFVEAINAAFAAAPDMSTSSTQVPASVDETTKDRQIAELEAEVIDWRSRAAERDAECDRRFRAQYDAVERATAAESTLKASREIADGLAGALRQLLSFTQNGDEMTLMEAARNALLAYDVARKGDGGSYAA